jgi:hypothetical protein
MIVCEEHHVATEPGTGMLARMLGAQAIIPNTTPLRGDQRVFAWWCTMLGAQAIIANTTPLRGDQRVFAWWCTFE